jgi:hypothetical protein
MSGINLISPSGSTSAFLIADTVKTTGGSNDTISTMTQVNGVTVNAALEVQSTLGSVLFPRMTQTQINALTTVVDGMLVFNTTTAAFNFRQGAAWVVYSLPIVPLVFQASVTLSSPQLLALNATPVTVLAALGANVVIVPLRVVYEYKFGTTPYVNSGAQAFELIIGTGPTVVSTTTSAIGLVDQAVNTTAMGAAASSTGAANTALANTPLKVTNTVGNFTAGDGTVVVTVWYQTITLT